MPITVSMIVLGTQLVVPVVHLAGEHRWYAKLRQLADMPPDGSSGSVSLSVRGTDQARDDTSYFVTTRRAGGCRIIPRRQRFGRGSLRQGGQGRKAVNAANADSIALRFISKSISLS